MKKIYVYITFLMFLSLQAFILQCDQSSFQVTSNSSDPNNAALWITVWYGNATYILANNANPSYSGIEVPTMTTFLNDKTNVGVLTRSKANWQDGIIFSLFNIGNDKKVYVAAYDQKNTTTPLITAELPGAKWSSGATVKWGGSYFGTTKLSIATILEDIGSTLIYGPNVLIPVKDIIPTRFSSTSSQSVLYAAGQTPQNTNTHLTSRLKPPHTVFKVMQHSFGVGGTNTDQLWLTMGINGKTYVLAWANGVGSLPPKTANFFTDDTLKNALEKDVSVSDWDNGIFFSFVEYSGQVYLYVQKYDGTTVGQVAIPGISSLNDITGDIGFIGSYLQQSIPIAPFETLGLTTGNFNINQYVQVNYPSTSTSTDTAPVFTSPQLRTVLQSSIGVGKKNQLWLSMSINGILYLLARSSGAGGNAPTAAVLDFKLKSALENLSIEEWQNGIGFTFVQAGQQVYLYVQDSDGNQLGKAAIPGMTNLDQIQNNVSFGGSYITQAISINPSSDTLVLTTGSTANLKITPSPNKITFTSPLITPTTPNPAHTLSYQQHLIGVGPSDNDTSQLWLTMGINGITYVLARADSLPATSNAPSTPVLDLTLKNALNNVSLDEWKNGVSFTFVETGQGVYLYVQNAAGVLIGQAVIPGMFSLTQIQGNVGFIGSYISQSIPINPISQTLVLTTTNADLPNFPPQLTIPTITPSIATATSTTIKPSLGKLVQGKIGIGNVDDTTALWLSMGLEGKTYGLVKASKAGTNAPAASFTDLDTALQALSTNDWDNGIIFSLVENNNQVSLNVQKSDGTLVNNQVILGLTGLNDITAKVGFKGSYIQQSIPLSPYHSLGLSTSSSKINQVINIPASQAPTILKPTLNQRNIPMSKASKTKLSQRNIAVSNNNNTAAFFDF
ncbi:MAG TPA: hypothetical protein VLG50_04775 [Candidatus Saccharimonadales bacterium]|nr:hypothetical protein [Candidatus Saccharimonadales bacterium]